MAPAHSVAESSTVAAGIARRSARKLPGFSWACSRASIRFRSAGLPEQAACRKSERSACGLASAAWKISSGFMAASTPYARKRAEKHQRFRDFPSVMSVAPNRGLQPGPGIGPMSVGGAWRYAQDVRGLIVGQTGKVAQLDEASLERLFGGEAIQRLVESQQFFIGLGCCLMTEWLSTPSAPRLLGLLAASLVDQDSPHGIGGSREEVSAISIDPRLGDAHQPQEGLVDQSCGFERLPASLLLQSLRRQLSQLIVDQRQELLGGLR